MGPLLGIRLAENNPAHILLMQSLHDNNNRRLLGIVQTGGPHLPPPPRHIEPLCRAFRRLGVVRVVYDDDIAALPDRGSAGGDTDAPAAGGQVEVIFTVLIQL